VKKGFIFTFEGGDFAGKGTLVKNLTDMLLSQGFPVSTLSYYEPGGTPYADMIRSFLKKTFDTAFAQKSLVDLKETIYNTDISPIGQALGFFTAREHQFFTKIRQEYLAGKIILLDRSVDSTSVYQGHAQDKSLLPWIRQTNVFFKKERIISA
jgi:dTMP kinase